MAHIAEINAKEYRRFTDIRILDIPQTAKLVVLVGPNGSGKSAIFDAINQWYRTQTNYGMSNEGAYYSKIAGGTLSVFPVVTLHEVADGKYVDMNGLVHVRSAYRLDADFTLSQINAVRNRGADPRIMRMIDIDQSVALNYQLMVSDVINEVFNIDSPQSVVEFREDLVGELRDRVSAVFPDLTLKSLGRPLDDGSFYFQKGVIDSFHYKNLSGGEKSVFDLLLDLHIATRVRRDRIYIIDEPELHTNSRIQRDLMYQMFEIIPNESQMWISTHSLGMLRAAKQLSEQHEGEVCFLSLYDQDSDGAVILRPVETDRKFWSRVFSETLEDFADLIAPREVILCEGKSILDSAGQGDGFDAACYNAIFASRHPDSVFISIGSNTVLQNGDKSIDKLVLSLSSGTQVRRLVDRDDMTDREVKEAQQGGIAVLGRREIESYLLDEEIIMKLFKELGQENLIDQAMNIVRSCLAAVRCRPGVGADEVKAARGDIHVKLQKLLTSVRLGRKAENFLRDILVPLVTPETNVYRELESSIWGTPSSLIVPIDNGSNQRTLISAD